MTSSTASLSRGDGGNGVRAFVRHGDPLLPLGTEGSEGAAKRRRLVLETEDEVPESDFTEFAERMEALKVERGSERWRHYWQEHARLRNCDQRGTDPAAEEESEETFMEKCDRLDAEEAERIVEKAEKGETGENEDEVENEDADESRPVRTRIASYVPTVRERQEHNVNHYPFRSWCSSCVSGRATAAPHLRGGDKEVPVGGEFHFDYCFLRKCPASDPATTLVGVDRTTQGVVAHVVPKKGTQFDWVATQLEKDVRKFGYHGRVVVKSDGENAIKDLMTELARKRSDMPTVVEHSKAYDSKSNGRAENTVRRVESQVRTMLIALQ